MRCSICHDTSGSLMCAACIHAELKPLRDKLNQVRELFPGLRASCREAFEASEARSAPQRRLERGLAETTKAHDMLEAMTRVVHRERVAVARERRRLTERGLAIETGEALLLRRRLELAAVRRAVFGDGARRKKFLESSPWRRASDVFALFPIARASAPPQRGSLRGVMTIVGLPLPNALGLAQAVPRDVCRTALAAVAQLVASVAAALRVELPHPLVPRSGQDAAAVEEKAPSRRRYPLSPPADSQNLKDADAFATALNLLQNDVTHVCVKAGVPPHELWPAEAILLNLVELRDKAASEVDKTRGLFADPATSEETLKPPSEHHLDDPDDDDDDDADDWIFLGNHSSFPPFAAADRGDLLVGR